jgi:hypothetical protein
VLIIAIAGGRTLGWKDKTSLETAEARFGISKSIRDVDCGWN